MEFFLAQLLNGLVYGMLLFLIAAGLSLIFGLMNVVSLVHGSFFMLGAFLALSIFQVTQSFWWALLLAPIPTALLGILIEMLFMRRLYGRSPLDQVLLTFGFTFVFYDVVKSIWGNDIQNLPVPDALDGVVEIGGILITQYRLFLIAFGVAVAALLWLFLDRSRLGAMVRAGVDNRAMASGLGANIPVLFTSVFGFGVALAAIGGVVAGPVLGLYPGMDADILIPAFIVIVIGGMGSLRGAFVGSLLIGIADVFGKTYAPELATFLIYFVMALVLLVRPQGLFGITIGEVPTSAATAAAQTGKALSPRIVFIIGLAAVGALLAYPIFTSDYPRRLVTEIYIVAIFAMSLDLLMGYTGLMSLGHAAFFGLGAYAVVILSVYLQVEIWLGLISGVVVSAAAAAGIGFFCVRSTGVTFLMLTLAFSQLVFSAASKWRGLTGGTDGIGITSKPNFLFWNLSNSRAMYYVALAFFLACYWGFRRLTDSPLGHVFVGIRENEWRMLAIGYPVRAYKLLSFTIGGAVAGVAGGLYAIFNGFISPDALHWSSSGDVLIMVMLGGTGTLIGPSIGAGVFLLMKNLISSYSEHWMMIIGAVFIACVLFFRGGAWGLLRRFQLLQPLKSLGVKASSIKP
jgi:branched-chain amino acid transport system permease protein